VDVLTEVEIPVRSLLVIALLAGSAPALAAGQKCGSNADCPKGELCDGADGCGATWTCKAGRVCTKDLVPFCGCDGVTFEGSSSCPGRKLAHRGPCKAPPPGPKVCTTSADCPKGQSCDGAEGCDAIWTCQPPRACLRNRVPFCGCDNRTFYGSSSCPNRKYAHRGPCEQPKTCTATSQCPGGQICLGPEGCASTWTCQPAPVCLKDLVRYCGCTGQTFEGSSNCPPRPYAYRGACGPAGGRAGPRTCTSSAQCGRNEICDGAPGCGRPWTCVPARPCLMDLVPFCGCDGKTFQASSTCPGRPHAHKGRCEALGNPAPKKQP
jgi:hypothetical protein